jgi:alpha-beta hydrolase superfamily lysophospholipase
MATYEAAPSPEWLERYEAVDVTTTGLRPHVLKIGNSPDAGRVLVLVGGREGGANALRPFARELVRETPDLQVWSVDRREQSLADLSGFGKSPAEATDYYAYGKYRTPADPSIAAGWGLEVLVHDLRDIVRSASDGGRRQVVLGGVSVGANAVLNYAAWDFDGEPGYRDLSGLVIADGGVYDAYSGAGMEFGLTPEVAKG